MAKELPYFKFEPSQWENGNVQMLSNDEKVLFINICCMYWARLGDLPEKLVVLKLCGGNAVALISLYDEGVIEDNNGMISVKFLDEQLKEFDVLSQKNSQNAKGGWEKRRANKATNATASISQSQNDAIREDKRREENIKRNSNTKVFTPPIIEDVIGYFLENGYTEISAKKAFAYYESGNWSDSKGQKVKNWKQKMQGVWFTEENKIPSPKSMETPPIKICL